MTIWWLVFFVIFSALFGLYEMRDGSNFLKGVFLSLYYCSIGLLWAQIFNWFTIEEKGFWWNTSLGLLLGVPLGLTLHYSDRIPKWLAKKYPDFWRF